jgi:hypothetical protein
MIEPSTKVLDRIDFNYSKWVKIQVNATDEKSINEAGEYLIEIMIRAIKAEDEIKLEKKKANRTSKKNEDFYQYKKPEKADDEGSLSFLYETNPDKGIQGCFFYHGIIDHEIAKYMIQSGKLKLVEKKLHQGENFRAWTPFSDEELKLNK